MKIRKRYETFMRQALELAQCAAEIGDVPVGALIIDAQGEVIGSGHNRRMRDSDPTAHAEVLAIRQAAARVGDWRLSGTTMFVTLEPCPMCAGALVNARIDRLVFGCRDPKAGAVRCLYTLCEDPRLNHRLEIVSGVLQQPCSQILSDFFARLRDRRSERSGQPDDPSDIRTRR